MNLEEKRQVIKQKLDTKNYDLTKEELFIINNTPSLFNTMADILADESIWKHKKIDNIVNYIDIEDMMDYHNFSLIAYNYAKKEIDDGKIYDIENLYTLLTEEQIINIEEYLQNKLKEDDYPVLKGSNADEKMIFSLLKAERYKDLQKFNIPDRIYSRGELFNALMSAYKKEKFLFPSFHFYKKSPYHILQKYDFKELPFDIMLKVSEAYKRPDKNEIILNKLKETPKEFIPHNYNDWANIIKGMNEQEQKETILQLLEKGNIDLFIFENNNIKITDEIIDKIVTNIKSGSKIFLSGKNKRMIDKGQLKCNKKILNHPKVVEAFIEQGNLTLAQYSDLFDNYIDKIIALINDKNLNYQNVNVSINLIKYPTLFEAFLKNGNYSPLRSGAYISEYYEKEIFKTIIQDTMLKKDDLPINYYPYDKEFSKKLLRNKKWDYLLNMPVENSFMEDQEFKDLLLDSCRENLYFANVFIGDEYHDANIKYIFQDKRLVNFFLTNELFTDRVIEYIDHHEELERFYNEETYQKTKKYFSEKYNLNIENMDRLEEAFGPKLIRYITNENIQKIISLDEDKIKKVISLLPKNNFFMRDAEAMYDALKQYQFSKLHPEIINIFPNILHSLEDQDNKYLEYIKELTNVMDDKFFHKFREFNPAFYEQIEKDPKKLLKDVIYKIETTKETKQKKQKDILHFITDYYISIKREEYRKTYNMPRELELNFKYDEKDVKRYFINGMLDANYSIILDGKELPLMGHLSRRLKEKGMDQDLIRDCKNYYLNNNYYKYEQDKYKIYTNDLETIRKNLKTFLKETQAILDQKYTYEYKENIMPYFEKWDGGKRNYYVQNGSIDPYMILSTLRIDLMEENILKEENKESFASLQKTMNKYKLNILPDEFSHLLEKEGINIEWTPSNIAGFISFYSQIYETEKKRLQALGKNTEEIMLNIPNTFIQADIYSSSSSVYTQFLGKEDCNLIKSNPGPNAAAKKTANDERLREAVNLTIDNFKRMEVTIPTFNEVYPLEDKSLRAIVGNFTHPSNITHGERTGACMRIGGVGDSLFDFCLKDKNGFHIRFENPNTNEYISRVSGFRNGNTVFLNELRYSCNEQDYSNLDVVESCKKVAQDLIEKSKNTTFPIDNVVISKDYAMGYTNEQLQDLHVNSIKVGLKNFYSDVGTSAIVLASSKTNNELVPIDFNKEKIETFLPARELVKETYDNTLLEDINRVHSVNAVLNGEEYQYVEPISLENDIKYAICNQDWYIYIDGENKMHSELIPIDLRAKEEFTLAYNKVCEMYNKSEKIEGEKYGK